MRTGQSGWIDAVWATATGAAAVAASAPQGARGLFCAALAAFWALRLAGHIASRTRGAGDDPRYAALAREWGADFPRRLFIFLQIQAAASLPLVAGVALAASAPRPFPDVFDGLGLLVALAVSSSRRWPTTSCAGSARARRAARSAKPASGGTRAIPIISANFCSGAAWPLIAFGDWRALAALAAPAFMYYLLNHVSGAPLLEKQLRASRGAAFDAYAARVPRFFPGPPRKTKV